MVNLTEVISGFIIGILIVLYILGDYLKDLSKAIRELTIAVKDNSLKQEVELNNICSAIKNIKKED